MSNAWVKSGLPPMVGPLPAWIILPWPYLLINWGFLSVMLTLGALIAGIYLKTKGRTLTWMIRRFRTTLRGNRTDARPLGYRRAVSADVALFDFNLDSWRKR